MAVTRDDRLQVRVDAEVKRRLEAAANAAHLSLSAFVLQAARLMADEMLVNREVIALSPAAAAAFDEAMTRPAQVNDRLAAALERPASFTWLD